MSRLHPYPAMVADELALNLAERYVKPGDSVLDPFCGSGRLLAAAARQPGKCVGFDANPLACLLTRAKLASPKAIILGDILDDIEHARMGCRHAKALEMCESRQVQWFPTRAIIELAQIVHWINKLKLEEPERLIVAAALSGAARDASYARQNCWKLHRLDALARQEFFISPWDAFEHRLRYCFREVSRDPPSSVNAKIEIGDARRQIYLCSRAEKFDVVLTSPPYGDSRTTVQYGAASALCLEFVCRIEGFEEYFVKGSEIDASCLGGLGRPKLASGIDELRPYWAGRKGTPYARRVSIFLEEYANVCAEIAGCIRPGGSVIFVVGQRSTGGFRVKLDQFTIDRFEAIGLRTMSVQQRRLEGKRLPRRINRYARSSSVTLRARGMTRTISSEIILAFRKKALVAEKPHCESART